MHHTGDRNSQCVEKQPKERKTYRGGKENKNCSNPSLTAIKSLPSFRWIDEDEGKSEKIITLGSEEPAVTGWTARNTRVTGMRTKRMKDEERTKWRDERRMENEREVHYRETLTNVIIIMNSQSWVREEKFETTIEKVSARSLFDTWFNTLHWKTHTERMKQYDNYKMKSEKSN